jgi:PAS domain S-box-containing protein
LGKGLHLLLAPERYHEAYREGFGRFKTTGQGPAVGKTLELEAVRKDGTELPVELSLSAVKLGGKWNAIGIMRDITERKRAEEALRISEERFALAVQGSNDGIWDWDIQNNSLYWSPRLKELLGYADDELDVDCDTFDSHLHPDDRERMGAAIEAHLKDRGLYDVEQRLRTKSGQYRWFRARGQHFGTRPEIPFA